MDPQAPEAEAAPVDTRPWRKRHPVLSRVLLFGIGGLLAAALIVALQDDTHERQLVKLQGEVDSFDAVMTLPGGPERLLSILDEKFAGVELPKALAIDAERYRAMAMRTLWRQNRAPKTGGPSAEEVEAVHARAFALAPEGDRLRALLLEWAEWRLEQEDPDGALERLDRTRWPTSGPWFLLQRQIHFIARAVGGDGPGAARQLTTLLESLPTHLPTNEAPIHVGGGVWHAQDVALVLIQKAEALFKELGRDPASLWTRLEQLVQGEPDAMLRAARMLADRGERASARALILGARELDPDAAQGFLAATPAMRELLLD